MAGRQVRIILTADRTFASKYWRHTSSLISRAGVAPKMDRERH